MTDEIATETCRNCDGKLMVCENHPNRPWAGESSLTDACECGAGMLCPVCGTEDKYYARLKQISREGRMICSVFDGEGS